MSTSTVVASVAVSVDGRTWEDATLGEDLGRFSFRQWRLPVTFAQKGKILMQVRATSNKGEVQPLTASWNPAGYLRNVVESTPINIA